MKILSLRTQKGEPYVIFTTGEIFDQDNYIRELVEGCYAVDFTFKDIDITEKFIVTALTNYFSNLDLVDLEDLEKMFKIHQDNQNNEEEITEIKKICLKYLKDLLSGI